MSNDGMPAAYYNNKLLHLSFVICHLSFLLFSAAGAQEIPVNVKAEQLKYIEGSTVLEAVGEVEVKLKEVTIKADRLLIDSTTKIVTAEGHVLLTATDYQAAAAYLVFRATDEVATFTDFHAQTLPKDMKGYVYLSAQQLVDLGQEQIGHNGQLTTCASQAPHYYLRADKMVYCPNDKVIATNVTVYVGQAPVLWLPWLVYFLDRGRSQNWEFGHNEVEGDYLKSSWAYAAGTLYLDLIEKKGLGLGLGLGTLYLYHIREKDTGLTDWITRLNLTRQINPDTTLKLNQSYTATYLIPTGRQDQTALSFDLNYQRAARWNLKLDSYSDRLAALQKYTLQFNQADKDTATNYNINYDYATAAPNWLHASQRLYHRRSLWSDKVTFTGWLNYYDNVAQAGRSGDEQLDPAFEIQGRDRGYTWLYRSNWYLDLDRDAFLGDESYQYLEKLPEIEINPSALILPLVTLSSAFGYGYYHEVAYVPQLAGNRDFRAGRYRASLNASQSVPLGLGTAALISAGLDQFLYGPGDQRYAYRESLSLRTDGWGFLRNDLDYKKGFADGNTPFIFDQLNTHYHNLTENLTFYYLNKLRWTTSAGYNWQTEKWLDVMTNFNLIPGPQAEYDLRAGWDIANRRYKDLINSVRLYPYSFLVMQFNAVSDPNVGQLRSGSAVYELYLLEGQPNQWRLKVSQVYEPNSQQFKVRDIMVVKDLHCWELKYAYSDYRKEFSLTFSLKAAPDKPAGFSTGRGFYVEGFEEELKTKMMPEKAIRRY